MTFRGRSTRRLNTKKGRPGETPGRPSISPQQSAARTAAQRASRSQEGRCQAAWLRRRLGARASCVPVRSSLLLGARLRSARHRRRNKLSVVTHPHLRLEPSNFRAFYCSAALNRAVNGAANSAHLWGGAADFTVPGFGDPADVIRIRPRPRRGQPPMPDRTADSRFPSRTCSSWEANLSIAAYPVRKRAVTHCC